MSSQRNLYDKHRRTYFLPPPFLDVRYLNMSRLVSPNCTILACAASERRLSALFFTSFIDCNVHIRISILHSQPSTVIYSSESYLENSYFYVCIQYESNLIKNFTMKELFSLSDYKWIGNCVNITNSLIEHKFLGPKRQILVEKSIKAVQQTKLDFFFEKAS